MFVRIFRRIKNKVDVLLIELRSFDIISLTETWLNDESELVPETLFENFKHPYTYIRTIQVGGGISVYVKGKIEKVPRGIRGEKSSKDMASSRNLVSIIGALASPKMGDGTRCPEG